MLKDSNVLKEKNDWIIILFSEIFLICLLCSDLTIHTATIAIIIKAIETNKTFLQIKFIFKVTQNQKK